MKLFRLYDGSRFNPSCFAFSKTVKSEHPMMSAMSCLGFVGNNSFNMATFCSFQIRVDPFLLMVYPFRWFLICCHRWFGVGMFLWLHPVGRVDGKKCSEG
jgi:hypothetical protein